MDTKKIEDQIKDILDNLQCILDSHEGCAELIEVKDNKAVLFCGGKCAQCDNKCVVDAIKEKLPDIEVILR
jgi:Fe-S cluster biogenesis protein NfuA